VQPQTTAEIGMPAVVDVVVVEPGVTTAVERWMLDLATCATMELGESHLSLQALTDLDRRYLRTMYSGKSFR